MLLMHTVPTKPAPDPLLDKLINPRRKTSGVQGLFNPRPFADAAKDLLLLGTSRRGAARRGRHPRDPQAGRVGRGAEELHPHRVRGPERDPAGVAARPRRSRLRHLSQRVGHQPGQVQGRTGRPAPRSGPHEPRSGEADRDLSRPAAPHGRPGVPDLPVRLGRDGSAARRGEGLRLHSGAQPGSRSSLFKQAWLDR